VSPQLVREVADGQPQLFANRPSVNRSGSNLMVGADANGRFWTIVVLELGDDVWRPITGWPSTNSEIRLYNEATDD
jgi:hypothetical protein